MKITVQLTSHAEAERGETERMAEVFHVEFKRNGQARDAFLRNVAAHIRSLAAAYNAKFDEEHGISQP
jgi:hypothetical protein